MQLSSSIVILNAYFGELPWYFSFFLHSCKYNPTIDILIFSDTRQNYQLPQNVKIVYKTLSEVQALASRKLGFEVFIDSAYKLCDFKPAYGLIFEDYTKGYDFWAQSDIDVIYGDLRSFFTPELMKKSDFINVRHDYTTGCFMLFRNTGLMNKFFKKSKDYKKVFTSREYLGFDELNYKHWELWVGKTLDEIHTDIECFTHLTKKANQNKEINACFDFILIEGVPGKIKFIDGKLIYKNQFEVALYHLFWLKKVYCPKTPIREIPDIYHISPTRIYINKRNKIMKQ
jgi:hypothetical protein